MDSQYPADGRYPASQQWGPAPQLHLQVPQSLASSTFPSPVSPSPSLEYPPYYHPHPPHHDGAALSLNLSGLSVASPTTISPIHPSPHPSSSTLSPITPLTPPTHSYLAAQHTPHQFSFAPPPAQYDYRGSSRSSSCSEKSVPRKRSFSTTPLATIDADYPFDDAYAAVDGSPVDGSTSSGEMDEKSALHDKPGAYAGIPPGSINILGKPAGTNNFVTKLYQ
ncbi:hypothetical protein NEOLEDRAFT_805512 [Neolentinus lepideus HHB14362 ss-1]|uniref:Uncharacterized protein n=1 Tax=Neolentinus lepideus HHB14362 ss-1 TaxID=1314782 RepID=A0A165PFI6_9AGAM|nr:hypothetical protein NEOLEDRAFT_805512 [Neolentinus lepideus HHB14362 ss-1]